MAEQAIEIVLWTESAKKSFQKIVKHLQQEWSDKEVSNFINRTQDMIEVLKRYPEMCRPSNKRKNVRIGILDKHTQLIYYYSPQKNSIKILLFWGMKQNPEKLKF